MPSCNQQDLPALLEVWSWANVVQPWLPSILYQSFPLISLLNLPRNPNRSGLRIPSPKGTFNQAWYLWNNTGQFECWDNVERCSSSKSRSCGHHCLKRKSFVFNNKREKWVLTGVGNWRIAEWSLSTGVHGDRGVDFELILTSDQNMVQHGLNISLVETERLAWFTTESLLYQVKNFCSVSPRFFLVLEQLARMRTAKTQDTNCIIRRHGPSRIRRCLWQSCTPTQTVA